MLGYAVRKTRDRRQKKTWAQSPRAQTNTMSVSAATVPCRLGSKSSMSELLPVFHLAAVFCGGEGSEISRLIPRETPGGRRC